MEALGGLWSYRDQMASSSSYSSPGTVSSAYTSTTGSHLSSIPTEAAINLELEDSIDLQEERERRTKQIKSTVQEFFRSPSANRSVVKGGDMRVLGRWFTELGVGWVLHLPVADGTTSSSGAGKTYDARTWIWALAEIMETIHFTTSLFPDRSSLGLLDTKEAEEEATIRDQYRLARFIQEAMLTMLAFVDVIAAAPPVDDARTTAGEEVVVSNGVPLLPYAKLRALLGVRGALSRALTEIRLSFHSPLSAQVESIVDAIISLLSAKESKAGEAIWSIMVQHTRSRTHTLEMGTHQGSSDIHKGTRSVITNIKFLLFNYSSVAAVVSEAANLGKYVPQIGSVRPLDSMIIEMASCLEENLASRSQSFADQGLRFLFLLNNSYFIRQQNLLIDLDIFDMAQLTRKVEDYMETYLQVSWSPVLSCLLTPTPSCFGKNCSPLPKFEFEFQKTYSTQKLWKVPDPELRKNLRRAITEKINSGYTKYIEDNNVTTLKFTPQNLQEMLQELFEG